MQFIPTAIPDVILIQPDVRGDARGFFMETFHEEKFHQAGIETHFVQDNHSGSRKGILRGLHYQIHQAQAKMVRTISGSVFDVAVDLRRSSPTFAKWVGCVLSAENRTQIWVPRGFAHGFYVLSDWAEIAYKADDFYAPEHERTLLWNDPTVKIDWPISPEEAPLLSGKDSQGSLLQDCELFD